MTPLKFRCSACPFLMSAQTDAAMVQHAAAHWRAVHPTVVLKAGAELAHSIEEPEIVDVEESVR